MMAWVMGEKRKILSGAFMMVFRMVNDMLKRVIFRMIQVIIIYYNVFLVKIAWGRLDIPSSPVVKGVNKALLFINQPMGTGQFRQNQPEYFQPT